MHQDRISPSEISRITATIGQPTIASKLFRPRVDGETVQAIATAVLSRLKTEPAHLDVRADMAALPPDRVASWAAQAWINAVAEFCEADPEMERAVATGGYLPRDPALATLFKRKFNSDFHSFLWIVGWRDTVGDLDNCFTARLLILDSVIRIEDLKATKDGNSGGWGLLGSVVDGAKMLCSVTNQRIKTVATTPEVEAAFRRRGFTDANGSSVAASVKSRSLQFITDRSKV